MSRPESAPPPTAMAIPEALLATLASEAARVALLSELAVSAAAHVLQTRLAALPVAAQLPAAAPVACAEVAA